MLCARKMRSEEERFVQIDEDRLRALQGWLPVPAWVGPRQAVMSTKGC